MDIKIYTDGACSGNPGPGAFAYIIVDENDNVLSQYSEFFANTTNNRMELLAVITALMAVSKKPYSNITVYSDSQYVVKSINNGWVLNWQKQNFKNKKNVDLWKFFIEITRNIFPKFVWVKGHDTDYFNKKCDAIAREAISRINK